MRNAAIIGTTLFTLLALGCAGNNVRPGELDAAEKAFAANDYEQAIAQADAALDRKGSGSAVAEAHYVRGRAIEDSPVKSEAEKQSNLQAARTSYIAALEAKPTRPLEGLIRASVADVAFWQDDYATAASQWEAAVGLLEDRAVAGWSLYLSAVSHQRIGRFEDADKAFARVQNEFPGSEPARKAREQAGKRNFIVQVATFANPAVADQCVKQLQAMRLPIVKRLDGQNRSVVTIGAYGKYTDAAAARAKVAGTYPDAVVVP